MFRLWLKLIKMNVLTWMEYRADFFIGLSVMFFANFISIIFFWIIFQKIPNFNGWSFNQLLFLLGFLNLSFSIWHVFFDGISPWRVERYVRTGTFDRILLQPINPLLYLVLSFLDDDGWGDFLAGIIIVYLASSWLGLVWTIQTAALFLVLMLGAALIVLSSMLLMSALTFFVIKTRVLSDIFWNFTKFLEYPIEIYNPIIIFILTFVVPFAFINYYPAQVFIGKGLYLEFAYLTPLVGVVMFAIAYAAWRIGLKNYTSTGS